MSDVSVRWERLVRFVNNRPEMLGETGVRDPEYRCSDFDALGYQGRGDCMSDGHYLCDDCSLLSPDADRFHQYGADGRLDRLRLFSRRKESRINA